MNIQTLKQQAQTLFQQQRLDEARAAYEKLCRAAPKDGGSWNMLGALNGMLGDLAGAEKCFRRALDADPAAAGVHTNLGNALQLQGKLEEAERSYRKALKLTPNNWEALTNLGNLLRRKGEQEQAEQHYRQALLHNPAYADAHSNLGVLLHDQGKHDEAISHYAQALRLQPQHFDARHNLVSTLLAKQDHAQAETHARGLIQLQSNNPKGWTDLASVLIAQKRYVDAIDALTRAITLQPDNVDAHFSMGVTLKAQGKFAEAADMLHKTLELDPNHECAGYYLATLGATPSPEQSPTEYVRKLFDAYAENFEQDLVQNLEYRTPEVLYQIVTEPQGENPNPMDIIDLGCGTGLCGKLFKSVARSLTGVDLSPKMVEKARQLNVYDQLITGDVLQSLQVGEPAFDLVLAADVFVYIGKLDEIFAASHNALRSGGLFAFSVEADETREDYVLRPSGRYGHSAAYIRTLAEKHGQQEVSMREVVLRKEAGIPMQGYLFVFRKP